MQLIMPSEVCGLPVKARHLRMYEKGFIYDDLEFSRFEIEFLNEEWIACNNYE